MAALTLPEFTPGLAAVRVDQSLRLAIMAVDRAQECAVLWFAEIARRPVPDVLIIGHTDTVGTDAFNDGLSRQRGEVVRKALLARGIQIENVVVVGRGKREPIVPTADNVAEPRNRRV